MKILFTGGGTGGHIYPILAVNEQIKKITKENNLDTEIYYVGSPEAYENILSENNISVSKIVSAKVRRYFDLRNLIDVPKFFISVLQAFWKVFFIMPDVLFSKGGPGALPVVLACSFYKIPIIIHESDSVAGMTNLVSSRFAERIGISFVTAQESFLNYFKNENKKQTAAGKIALVGNPIRSSLKKEGDSATFKKLLGFDAQKPLLMVICGSQGSTRINDFLLSAADSLLTENFQVLHQTGVNNFEQFNKELNVAIGNAGEVKTFYKTVPYFDENIKNAYMAADLVVSRSGSGSIFEIAAMEKPSILIPLADSAGDHQRKNAYEYANTGAAVVIEESNLTLNVFENQLKKIFSNAENLVKMSEAAGKFSKPEAAGLIASEIIKLGSRVV